MKRTMKICLGLGVELVRALYIVQNILFPFMRNATLRQKQRVLLIGLRAIDDPGWFPYHKILAQKALANDNDFSFADFNPFEHAYCQPSLRANPNAKPEQPFPPSQLGQIEETFVDNPFLMAEGDSLIGNNGKGGIGDKATVRLKSFNHCDRIVLNHWWKQQLDTSGK